LIEALKWYFRIIILPLSFKISVLTLPTAPSQLLAIFYWYINFFLAIKTTPPTKPISKAKRHTIVAKIKNTGSSPVPAQKPSPNMVERVFDDTVYY